jgi:hypothetical protein
MADEKKGLDIGFKIEPATPPPDPGYDFSKPSKAVIACDGDGNGIVLWYTGAHLVVEICEHGCGVRLDDLGLDDAPEGISVWEGIYYGTQHETMDGVEYDTEVSGDFRKPTAEEWDSIRDNVCPWD